MSLIYFLFKLQINFCNFISLLIFFLFFRLQLEEIYKKCHSSIRSDPTHKKPAAKSISKKRWTKAKLTLEQRKQKVTERKAAWMAKLKSENEA